VLALAVQTDAFGVPWLAYCVWGLCGAAVAPSRVASPAANSRAGAHAGVKGAKRALSSGRSA